MPAVEPSGRRNLTREVLRAVHSASGQTSVRQLAREAGVSEALLRHLASGRSQVTTTVAERLAAVFARWGERYQELAQTVRAAAREVPPTRGGRPK